MRNINFKFEKFGCIEKGNIDISPLTIITGPNNSGKSYISYAIYGIFKDLLSLINFNLDEKKLIAQMNEHKFLEFDMLTIEKNMDTTKIGEKFSKKLDEFFNTSHFFEDSLIDLTFKNVHHLEKMDMKLQVSVGKTIFLVEFFYSNKILKIYQNPDDKTLSTNTEFPDIFLIDIIKDAIMRYFFEKNITSPFIITSERTGASLFYKALDKYAQNIMQMFNAPKFDPIEILHMRSRYPEPIQDNIDIIRDNEQLMKQKSFITLKSESPDPANEKFRKVLKMLEDILSGSFKATKDEIFYTPTAKSRNRKIKVPLSLTASATKSLFLINLYIKHLAQENQLLIIDEPELHLSTLNQRKMAGLIAALINIGVKCLVTTHSDYLIREINNRIMLSGNFQNKKDFLDQISIDEIEVIEPHKVNAFEITSKKTIKKSKVLKYGIQIEFMEDVIINGNDLSQEIVEYIEEFLITEDRT